VAEPHVSGQEKEELSIAEWELKCLYIMLPNRISVALIKRGQCIKLQVSRKLVKILFHITCDPPCKALSSNCRIALQQLWNYGRSKDLKITCNMQPQRIIWSMRL
jgi:hypothetical protein